MIFEIVSSFGQGNEQVFSTMKAISDLQSDDEVITFDFTRFIENNPLNILLIANSIVKYKKLHPNNKFRLIPKQDSGFLSHLGFYNLLGADYGNKLGQAKANESYVPITKIDFGEMSNGIYDDIEIKAVELARLLNFNSDLCEFSKYVLIETIRNVYEHAETNELLLCAQKWKTMSLVEIAIVDSGCGIAKALNKQIKDKTERELIYLASMPGISAKSNHAYLDNNNAWRNSGFGLYVLKELAEAYDGSFVLCSESTALYYYNGIVNEFETLYNGTGVAIRIKTDTNRDFKRTLHNIVKMGESITHENKDAIKRASKSSGGNYNGQT